MWNWLDKWVLAGERLFLSFVWLFSPIYKKWKNLLKYFQFTWFLTCNFPFSHPGKKTFSWKNIFPLGFAHESLFFLCVYFFPRRTKTWIIRIKKNYQNPFLYSFSQKISWNVYFHWVSHFSFSFFPRIEKEKIMMKLFFPVSG